MPTHLVKQGECLSSIAARYGFSDWRSIYEASDNAEFREKRPNPHLLYPGDKIVIPKKKPLKATMKGGEVLNLVVDVPKRLVQMRLLDGDGQPMSDQKWIIEGIDALEVGTTDADGYLEAELPAQLARATLEVGETELVLELGGLDPLREAEDDGLAGLRGRLVNLGYDPGPDEAEMTEQTRIALAAFQRDWGLDETGELTSETLAKLEEVHGC